MEFRHVEAFVSVAELESFTRAGDQLHLTQSAVSQLIRRLEEELGEPLFVRNGRRVRLTRTGVELLPSALDIMKLRTALIDKVAPRPEDIGGGLRVGTSSAATAYLWAKTYQAFALRYPKIDLDVRATPQTQNTVEDLLSGELDIGVLPFPLASPRLVGKVLGHHEALLLASPAHPLTKKGKATSADLNGARFILYEHRMNFRALADNYFRETGINPKIVLQSNDTNLIRAMTEVGFGLAFLPDWAVQRELKEKRLVVIRGPGPRLREEFGVVHLAHGICAAAQEFVKFCIANNHLLPEVARGGFTATSLGRVEKMK
jgi:LysR family transcriptional regulator, transcriptional activator of the cysJI operon